MTDAERIAELETSIAKIFAALPALFAFRDNHLLWMQETGLFDLIVQDVLSRVPVSSSGTPGPKGDQGIQGIQGPAGSGGSGTGASVQGDALPPAFQWARTENGFASPAGSGGPSGKPADLRVHRDGFVCVANVAPDGTTATSGPNGQVMGIGGQSKGKIRVNTRGGAESDGGMRDMTNYVEMEERPGVGTISRRGYDIYCSVPDAVSIRTALWTTNPDGKRDGGIFLLKKVNATHFVGNWSDPSLDYENRSFVISGSDQPDKDRFTTKAGMDSNGTYGWRVDKPRNSTESHPGYDEGGYTDSGDFLLRLFHSNDSQDVGRYSRFRTYNQGRGIAFGTSSGQYANCPDSLIIQPGKDGQPGRVDLVVDGAVRVLESYTMPDGRVGICYTPGRAAVAPGSL